MQWSSQLIVIFSTFNLGFFPWVIVFLQGWYWSNSSEHSHPTTLSLKSFPIPWKLGGCLGPSSAMSKITKLLDYLASEEKQTRQCLLKTVARCLASGNCAVHISCQWCFIYYKPLSHMHRIHFIALSSLEVARWPLLSYLQRMSTIQRTRYFMVVF